MAKFIIERTVVFQVDSNYCLYAFHSSNTESLAKGVPVHGTVAGKGKILRNNFRISNSLQWMSKDRMGFIFTSNTVWPDAS